MKIRDVMTTQVWSVTPETPLKDVAAMLVTANVSGLPVCDSDRRVMGVVSERDIIVKEQLWPEQPGRIARLLAPADEDQAKAEAHVAGEAMTSPALTIGPDALLFAAPFGLIVWAADELRRYRLRRRALGES